LFFGAPNDSLQWFEFRKENKEREEKRRLSGWLYGLNLQENKEDEFEWLLDEWIVSGWWSCCWWECKFGYYNSVNSKYWK